jgi:FKBP-type peptidyl-prolyl cis-trans isomerase SlpA
LHYNKKQKIFNMSVITENSKVKVHYTGKFSDGEVFDSSRAVEGTDFQDREPLEVKLGEGMLIPGFESGLQGMKEGETKTVTIKADDAYGPIREDHMQEVEKQYVPDTVKEGEMLQANGPQGMMTVTVKEVKEETVILDANHPLAGKDLTFDLEVVSIS